MLLLLPSTSVAANTTVADPTCHAKANAGYAGDGAVVWGSNLKLTNAGECCRACQAHARVCGQPGSAGRSWWPDRPRLRCGKRDVACSIWSFCPGSAEVADQCFAFDIHVHSRGECWLKFQRETPTRPKDPFFGHTRFPTAMRTSPRRHWPFAVAKRTWPGPMPERIPWTSGVLAPVEQAIVPATPNDPWWERFCARRGPCEDS